MIEVQYSKALSKKRAHEYMNLMLQEFSKIQVFMTLCASMKGQYTSLVH